MEEGSDGESGDGGGQCRGVGRPRRAMEGSKAVQRGSCLLPKAFGCLARTYHCIKRRPLSYMPLTGLRSRSPSAKAMVKKKEEMH